MLIILRSLYERQAAPGVTFSGSGGVAFSASVSGAGTETFIATGSVDAFAPTVTGVGLVANPVTGSGSFAAAVADLLGIGIISGGNTPADATGGGPSSVFREFIDTLDPALVLALADEDDEDFAELLQLTRQGRG